MATRYRIYEGLPDHAALAGEEGGSVSLYETFKTMAQARWSGQSITFAYNAILRGLHRSIGGHIEPAERLLLPVAVMLVDTCAQQVLASERIESKWSYCLSPSFQAELGRIIRRYYPNVVSRPIRQEDLRGVQQ